MGIQWVYLKGFVRKVRNEFRQLFHNLVAHVRKKACLFPTGRIVRFEWPKDKSDFIQLNVWVSSRVTESVVPSWTNSLADYKRFVFGIPQKSWSIHKPGIWESLCFYKDSNQNFWFKPNGSHQLKVRVLSIIGLLKLESIKFER